MEPRTPTIEIGKLTTIGQHGNQHDNVENGRRSKTLIAEPELTTPTIETAKLTYIGQHGNQGENLEIPRSSKILIAEAGAHNTYD